jgi:hypothetical protein
MVEIFCGILIFMDRSRSYQRVSEGADLEIIDHAAAVKLIWMHWNIIGACEWRSNVATSKKSACDLALHFSNGRAL